MILKGFAKAFPQEEKASTCPKELDCLDGTIEMELVVLVLLMLVLEMKSMQKEEDSAEMTMTSSSWMVARASLKHGVGALADAYGPQEMELLEASSS